MLSTSGRGKRKDASTRAAIRIAYKITSDTRVYHEAAVFYWVLWRIAASTFGKIDEDLAAQSKAVIRMLEAVGEQVDEEVHAAGEAVAGGASSSSSSSSSGSSSGRISKRKGRGSSSRSLKRVSKRAKKGQKK